MTPPEVQSESPAAASADDPRVVRALEEYIAAMEAGSPPPRDEFLARHADVAAVLADCLFGLEMVCHAGTPRSGGAAPAPDGNGATDLEPLGDFRIIREVGRGGMGVVYEAEQLSLGRRVALKVLPLAATLDPRQLQRFHNEARAAAGLHHTNIVPVYAVGCERGVHYYAMQFIEGRTLADLIAQQRGGPASQVPTAAPSEAAASAPTAPPAAQVTSAAPRDAAYFRRVAQWGIEAAEALDCAHTLGVVHRDVKPANLLVDAAGRLWVTDFGLAQVQSDARLTMTGDLVGTLRYMSPEQALAHRVVIDHRTDVYSLGATLYELLTLTPAFGGGDRQELLRQIAFEEPRPVRRLNKAVPVELETIVLKAMEKYPAERYATVKGLADDLRRWREDRPIYARRPTWGQMALKWARRHKPLMGAAIAVVMVATLMLAGGLGWVANDRATRRSVTAGVALQALKESEDLLSHRRLPEALLAAKRAVDVLPPAGEADPDVRRAAEARLADLELLTRVGTQRTKCKFVGNDPLADYVRFDAEYVEAFREANLDVDVLSADEAGRRIRATTVPVELASEIDEWAGIRHRRRVPGEADRWKHLYRVARAADPDPWRSRLREALEREDLEALKELASQDEAAVQLPATLRALTTSLRGAAAYDQAVLLLRKAQRLHPEDFWINYDLAGNLYMMNPPHIEEAIAFFRVAVAVDSQSAWAHNFLGVCLEARGGIDEAIIEVKEAVRLDKDSAQAHTNLGSALCEKGDVDGAIAEHKEAIRIKKDFADAHYNLGNALYAKGDADGAIAEFQEAVRLKKDDAEAHGNLGQALMNKGQFAEALTYLRRGHELGSKNPRWPHLSAQRVKDCERLVELDTKLLPLLKGEVQPADAAERLALAQLCQLPCRSLNAAAVRFYAGAFAEQPKLADDLDAQSRYNAACAAALAGCGQGKDADQCGAKERARLRRQAVEWLHADLAAYRRLLEKEPDKAGPAVHERMRHWQQDTDFAGVRGPEALARLPEAERQEWQKLWADVAEMLDRAEGRAAPEEKSPVK